jgi:serine/threonine protein kinase
VWKEKVLKMLPQFKREVRIMYEMNHVHIVKLYNHFEDEHNFYLIVELADSNLFSHLAREKQFLERNAAQYFREAVLAVEYLHCHAPPIIHRDIKPENILLDSHGRIKLTDFGWSNYSNEANLRQTLCGTMEYLPPEMIAQTGHDTSADIWCLGVLLFEMLAGYTPFKSNDQTKLLAK